MDHAITWGSGHYDTNHGTGAGVNGSCFEMLRLMFMEARTVYLRERDRMSATWRDRLGKLLRLTE